MNQLQLLLQERIVTIKSISRWRFERFLRFHAILETALGEEIEWFGDAVENTIGTIAYSQDERGWNYAVLKRDWTGAFQVCHLESNLYNLEAARVGFRQAMATAKNPECSFLRRSSE
jgi:hypothetical protein